MCIPAIFDVLSLILVVFLFCFLRTLRLNEDSVDERVLKYCSNAVTQIVSDF